MKLREISAFLVALMAIACLFCFTSSAFAQTNQSNQDIDQPAILVAPEPNFKINVYPKPSSEKRRIGYGLGGDPVIVLEQVGSNEGHTWNYVEFQNSSRIKGWIRDDFVAFQGKNAIDRSKPVKNDNLQNNWGNSRISNFQKNTYLGEHQRQQGNSYQYQEKQQQYRQNQY